MLVRHVGVNVPRRLMPMLVAVLTNRQRVVGIGVVAVVMAVGVFVIRLVVLVFVPVAFGQVEDDARGHQHRAPASIQALPLRSPSMNAKSAPTKGANAKTDPVRAAPKARSASR